MHLFKRFRFYGYAPMKTLEEGSFAVLFQGALDDTDRREVEDDLFECFDVVEWKDAVSWCFSSVPARPDAMAALAARIHKRFPIQAVVNHYAIERTTHQWETASRQAVNWPEPQLLLPKGKSYYAEGNPPPMPGRASNNRGRNRNSRRSSSRGSTSRGGTRPQQQQQQQRRTEREPRSISQLASSEREAQAPESSRPSERTSGTSSTWRLLNILVQTMQIDITRGASVNDITPDLDSAYNSDMTGAQLYEFLMEHPAVSEVYSDAAQLQALLNVW